MTQVCPSEHEVAFAANLFLPTDHLPEQPFPGPHVVATHQGG